MKLLVWDTSFKRAFKRVIRKNPQLEGKIFEILELLASDIFNPVLKSHKLSGQLEGLWACSVAYDCRIIYTLEQSQDAQEEIIVLVDIGSHDEVY
ncbi:MULTISPECIES: type II toxin-antitoxin system YafQ family toxin [Cyanophyceae]|uniref:type II toxin-antitoxin system RelE/ParE family toxin n=1 Tax=Cyanophyceae TaxID=3028117 RepID=UPI00232AA2A3|nr:MULTISPECIES: type II toxin-antitoxin system mRNA interferase toxin, RelE/StbE family [Cyanophyceae]MDB9358645.1 type II toxin-antitoxin system mRNA interferase toxin, RelE/StbE family [Nodularia spumigena CS-587/03]MDB9319252.1 type II toxin-antitoxin system mRNA interferase toxin, RelE/StbE family [Nodularia spumigena CS-590/01A]MDB9323632.1 type II toxin-antitoxin system mRNA interferase toxin, RelE/StbE family [Nodularia spumigena CS-591/07A]MDB9328864.1 type II toxin-antitoxin system mR